MELLTTNDTWKFVSPDLYRASVLFAIVQVITSKLPLHPIFHQLLYFNTLGVWSYTLLDVLVRLFNNYSPFTSYDSKLPVGPRLARKVRRISEGTRVPAIN